jgi:transcriptional regulator with XRE-family HTH domain
MTRLGQDARTARQGIGWTQAVVARRAACSQASVSRLEAGDTHLTIAIVSAVFAAMGIDFSARSFPGEGVTLRDSGQLVLAERIRELAHGRWRITLEEPIGDGTRRAADVLLDGEAAAAHIELESNLVDFQAQLRNGVLKREALQKRLGRPVAFVLALRDTPRNRAAVAVHRAVISAALPAPSREVLDAIRRGHPLTHDGLLFLPGRSFRP